MRNMSLLHCFADDAHQPLTNSFLRHIQRPFAPPTLVCSHNDANLSLQKGTVEMAFLYYATKRIRCTSTHTYVFLHLPKPKFPQLHSHWRSWDVFCKNSTVIRSPLLSKKPISTFRYIQTLGMERSQSRYRMLQILLLAHSIDEYPIAMQHFLRHLRSALLLSLPYYAVL